MILEGRVRVNRKTISILGTKVDPETDRIEVDGRTISLKGPGVYILLNKPRGCISALSDPLGRPVITDLVKKVKRKIFPVGRLDYDCEGTLVLTNDGELTNRLIHPRFSVPKKYLVKVKDVPDEKDLARLERGVYLEDGRTLPAKARLVRTTRENSWIELTVTEGRNRLVKRMCQAVGHPVAKLKRVEFAGVKLGRLKPGQFRYLTDKEVERLKGLAEGRGLDFKKN
jgi:pseudouridine synthase